MLTLEFSGYCLADFFDENTFIYIVLCGFFSVLQLNIYKPENIKCVFVYPYR